jgi:hypothetical protein
MNTERHFPGACGKVLLSHAAILSLHILAASITPPPVIQATAQLQKVIHPKGRSAG